MKVTFLGTLFHKAFQIDRPITISPFQVGIEVDIGSSLFCHFKFIKIFKKQNPVMGFEPVSSARKVSMVSSTPYIIVIILVTNIIIIGHQHSTNMSHIIWPRSRFCHQHRIIDTHANITNITVSYVFFGICDRITNSRLGISFPSLKSTFITSAFAKPLQSRL